MLSKTLVLGNNTQDTDIQTSNLANKQRTINHGLVDYNKNMDNIAPGFYHTSLADVSPGYVMQLASKFDEIVLLDQEEYSSKKVILSTFKLFVQLERDSNQLGIKVKYKENKNVQSYSKWTQYFKNNKSFCVYPWINYNDGYNTKGVSGLKLCARASTRIKEVGKLQDWSTDPDYTAIRQKMLKGELIPEHCSICYEYESKGLTSYRVHDSLDYIAQLEINELDDLKEIKNPYYYEIRNGNKCNLQCRMCTPNHSHLLEREFKKYPELAIDGQKRYPNYQYSNVNDVIDIDTLTEKHTVYFTGGEPTVMKETYEFMRKCIAANRTDFILTIGTNANFFSEPFWELASEFSNMQFSVSGDGFGLVNDYIRWRSSWDKIVATCEKIIDQGHLMSWNHVPTIWGIHRTHEFFEFASKTFPQAPLYLQYNRIGLTSAFVSPLVEQVKESMQRCMETQLYYSDGKDCKSGIDSFYDHYLTYKPDLDHLQKFFKWNDAMDKARNITMADFIPELDACRPY